jgi:peptidoglycan hydrolase CwlO-like protein
VLAETLTRVKLCDRIHEATKRIMQNYQKGLKEVEEAKTKINDLELTVTEAGSAENNRLKSALDVLIQLTDSITFESGRAWEEYQELEHDCKAEAYQSPELNELRGLCKKTEEFATDLLCYSLAHFKKSAYQDT